MEDELYNLSLILNRFEQHAIYGKDYIYGRSLQYQGIVTLSF